MTKKQYTEVSKAIFNAKLNSDQLKDLELAHRKATTYHRLLTLACNGYPKLIHETAKNGNKISYHVTDQELQNKSELQVLKIEEYFQNLCNEYNWKLELQDDPRGWEIKILVNDHDISCLLYY